MAGPKKGPRPGKDPKPIFQGLVIATAGSMGETWTDVNLSRWISLRKGSFVHQMDASVTHLVCTQEEAKTKTPKVREAIKRGSKNCKLVSKDWLEDSMHADRRLPEGSFSPLKAIQQEKKKEMREKQVAKGLEQAKKTVNTNYFHHYMDDTYFTYVVTLTRNDETLGAFGERYVLFLEESNAKPHLYLFFAKYYKSKGNTYAHIHRPTNTPGRFEDQFGHFKSFFEIKTNIPWEERLIKAGTTEKQYFQYTPPTGGKPLGWVPPGYEKPDPPEPFPPPAPQSDPEDDLPEPANLEILHSQTAVVENQLQAAGLLSAAEMALAPPNPGSPSGDPTSPPHDNQYPLLGKYLDNLPLRLKRPPSLDFNSNPHPTPPPPTSISSNTWSNSCASTNTSSSNETTTNNNNTAPTATPMTNPTTSTRGQTPQRSDQNVVIILD